MADPNASERLEPAPGRVLGGRYRLVSPLARGGMASVWIGHDELLARRVAVKTLRSDLAADPALRQRFRHEAIAAAGLSHPDIVATYDTGDDDGIAFIVMELVEGATLRALIDERGPLPVDEAVAIARQVAAALDHAHRNGIVHRDVKPANVLVPREGPVKVTDFGIAKAVGGTDGDLTRTGMVVGTARYLSPEQVRGEPSDARSDVYALGLLLYEMLTGQPAYRGDTEMATALARLAGPPAPLQGIRPDVPTRVQTAVERALQPAPGARFASAAAFADALVRDAPAAPAGTAGIAVAAPRPATTTGLGAPPRSPTGARATPTTTATTVPPPGTRRTTSPASRPRRTRWRRWLSVLLFLLFLAVSGAAAGYVTYRLARDDPSGSSGSSGAGVAIAAVHDFDPFGSGTPGEHPETVDAVVDHDDGTVWTTERYTTRAFGGAKPGVGLVLELSSESSVSRVTIDTVQGGYDVEIYVRDAPAGALPAWGSPRARGTGLASHATVRLEPSARGRAVLVWFTTLPESRMLEVREVTLA